MRILMIAQFYPPVVGGIEVHVAALARNLAGRGHELMVATFTTGEHAVGERMDGPVRVRHLQGSIQRVGPLFSGDRRHAIPLPDPGATAALRRIVEESRPDIVHAHNWLGRSYLPLKHDIGVPYVVSLHDSTRICAQSRWMYRDAELCEGPSFARCLACSASHFGALKGPATFLGNRLIRRFEADRVDMFLPVSRAVAESNHLALDGVPFEVMPNFSADAPQGPEPDDPRLSVLPEEPYILFVGDVVPDKGAFALLEAYERLERKPPLVVIGRTTDASPRRLPDGVLAVGTWPHELVQATWRRSLFGVVPSIFLDPCPTTAYEAMAASKAVVASARGGLLDQVEDGVTGILVTPGDAVSLAEAMARLIADADLRERMGAAGRERFLRMFAEDVIVDRIESVYRSLTS